MYRAARTGQIRAVVAVEDGVWGDTNMADLMTCTCCRSLLGMALVAVLTGGVSSILRNFGNVADIINVDVKS